MGVRIHKFLGYGLSDVVAENLRIVDERINRDSRLLDFDWGWGAEALLEYNRYVKARNEEARARDDLGALNFLDGWFLKDELKKPRRRRRSLDQCVAYSPEYGLPNVLCFQPVSCRDWRRYDDIIDWMVESYLQADAQTNRVDVFRHGIYPWSGSYMDARTGEPLPSEVMYWVRTREAGESQEILRTLAEGANFDPEADVQPSIPEPIRDLLTFAEVFSEPEVMFQLRPMLYTYWS